MEKMNNLYEAIKRIPEAAKDGNWVLTLDKDEGTLFYSPKDIPSEAELFQVTDESAIYLDKKSNPLGIMIEYYNVNFVEHHPEFKPLSDKIFGETDEDNKETVVKNPQKGDGDVSRFTSFLESTIIAEAFTKPVIAAK